MMTIEEHAKLYRIKVLHGAPKDSHTSTETYLVALSEGDVASWIEDGKKYGNWFTPYDGEEEEMRYDEETESEVTFKQWVLKNRGDLEDDEGWEDAYYGVTKWGWEPVEGATAQDMARLVELGIAFIAVKQTEGREG